VQLIPDFPGSPGHFFLEAQDAIPPDITCGKH
jgi:hypothetical protein